MYERALKDVLHMYGIDNYKVSDYQKGYRNEIWPVYLDDGRVVNVTFFKREAGIVKRIRRADAVSEYLATRGMPTRRRIDSRIVQLKNTHNLTNVGIYTYLSGETIPWEAYTMTHIKLLGKTMSDMHALLSEASVDGLLSVYDEYLHIITRMESYFKEPTVQRALLQKLQLSVATERLDALRDVLRRCQDASGQQALHMDFVRGNVLFDVASPSHSQQLHGLAISGILDFEKTSLGHPMVDIARTLAFLLVDCKYKTAVKVNKYFLYSGYQKRGMNSDIGDDVLRESLVELFLLHDFYKFLRHNPYESLYANEHYCRTRDILQQRNVIRYGYQKRG